MVIVTTAVYKVLDLLNQVLKYLHWAELTDYTCSCEFAVGYVFDKQSELFDLLNLQISLQANIIPKFLFQFAKFP
jgi:hypothetical protein